MKNRPVGLRSGPLSEPIAPIARLSVKFFKIRLIGNVYLRCRIGAGHDFRVIISIRIKDCVCTVKAYLNSGNQEADFGTARKEVNSEIMLNV